MRINWILGTVVVALGLIAGSIHDDGRKASAVKSADIPKENVVIAFAHKSMNSYFYTIMNEAVKRAVESKGWRFESSVADYDPMRQNQQIANFIKQKPDAIITTAIDSTAINEVIVKANEHDIPVCTIDTSTVGGELALDVSFDNYKAGQMAAELIVDKLTQKYGKPRGTVFNGYGELSSNAWRLRKEGFESVIEKYPGIIYYPRPTEGMPERVKEEFLRLFHEGVSVDAVHTPSEHPGSGLVEALQITDNWVPMGKRGHIILVTIDAEPYFVHLIKEGYADGAVSQDVIAYGNITVELIQSHILTGELLAEGDYYSRGSYWKTGKIKRIDNQVKVIIPPYVIDAGNCDDNRHWAYIAEKVWGFQYNR